MQITEKEIKEAVEERDYWKKIGVIIGATLHGWSGYDSASFINPDIDMHGKVAKILLSQCERIKELENQNDV